MFQLAFLILCLGTEPTAQMPASPTVIPQAPKSELHSLPEGTQSSLGVETEHTSISLGRVHSPSSLPQLPPPRGLDGSMPLPGRPGHAAFTGACPCCSLSHCPFIAPASFLDHSLVYKHPQFSGPPLLPSP